jgi:hypothetical protein
MTRAELADLVAEHVWLNHGVCSPIDRKYVGRLEMGEVRWPNARYRQALREILGAPTDQALGFQSTNAVRTTRSLDRREAIRAAAATVGGTLGGLGLASRERGRHATEELGSAGRADASAAGHLAAVVHELHQADDSAPTGSLLPLSAGLLAVAEQFAATAVERDQLEIGRVAAEAAMLHWWLTVDAGYDGEKEFDRALALAVRSRYSPLVGHLLGWRGGLALAEGDLVDAVRLTRLARETRWGMSSGDLAWCADYEARAHALAGDDESLKRAADDAQTAYEAVDPDSEPPWLYWLVEPVLTLDALDIRLLRDGPDAAAAVEAELARLPAERARDVAWYRAHIAAARARAGDVVGAAHDAEQAARLSVATGTTWTLAELGQLAEHPHLGSLREALVDSTAGSGAVRGTSRHAADLN